jgi:AraC-like DNA-binding protein
VEQALAFLQENYQRQPTLEEIAASISLSEYHFQRLFSRWVGISPKRFLQFLTKERAKELLSRSDDLLSVAYQSGLSGPSRLHDLFVNCEAVTPGEYKAQGAGLQITYGFHETPFGECLLATTPRGICALNFLYNSSPEQAVSRLQRNWQLAELVEDPTLEPGRWRAGSSAGHAIAESAAVPVLQGHQLSRSRYGKPCCASSPVQWSPMRRLPRLLDIRRPCGRSEMPWRTIPFNT